MKRRWMTSLAMLVLLTAVPAAGQERILGFLERAAVDDCIPTESNCERKPGIVRIVGWALADSGVRRVVVRVDGADIAEAGHGKFRPLVAQNHPGFPDTFAAGFGYNINASDFLNGVHQVTVRVETHAGNSRVLPAILENGEIRFDGIKEVFWSYNTSILHPFGKINAPLRNAELYGTCDRTNPSRRYTPVTGWVVDLGIETGDTGVGWVELLIDGAIFGNTRTDCRFDPAAGGLTDCFGLLRLDVENRFPFALDAPNSGFRFAIDVGFLLDNGYAQGHHLLTIRAGDISNQTANVSEIPVNLFCVENIPNESAFGEIEIPRPGRQFGGRMRFQGWALDGEGVDRVDVYVDGEFLGEARFGPSQGSRPQVEVLYPGFPDTFAPVWRLAGIDSNIFSDGLHQVQVIVTDVEGVSTLIGEKTFSVNNLPD